MLLSHRGCGTRAVVERIVLSGAGGRVDHGSQPVSERVVLVDRQQRVIGETADAQAAGRIARRKRST